MSKTTRHFRLALDFTIAIDDEGIAVNTPEEQEWFHYEIQLLKALLTASKEYQNMFISYLIANYIETVGWEHWYKMLLGEGMTKAQDVFHPLIATMSKEAQAFFTEVNQKGVFFENVEYLLDCFGTELIHSEISEVEA